MRRASTRPEESAAQIKSRAGRIGGGLEELLFLGETEVETIIADLRQRHGLQTAAHEVLFSLTRFKQNGARYA